MAFGPLLPRPALRVRVACAIVLTTIVAAATSLSVVDTAGAAPNPSAPTVNQTSGQMTVGKSASLRITASGFPRPTFTETGALPNGVTFQSGPGVALLTGTPSAGTGNDYNITITATNSVGTDANAPYDLTVIQNVVFPSNFCPPTMTVGQYTHDDQTVLAYPPFFGLGLSTTSPPNDITFSQNNTNEDEGTTSGTPQPGTGGKYHLQYSADTDPPVGNGQSKNFNCTVVIDQAPTFTDAGSFVLWAGQKLWVPVFIGGTTGYPKAVTVTPSGTLPAGLSQQTIASGKSFGISIKGTITGAPGDYPITVTADNGLTTSEQYVLVVHAPGTPAAPTISLSTAPSSVPYDSSAVTYTATVTGGSSPTGYVQFTTGNGLTTVPLSGGQASFTTPSTLDVGDYTVSASYTGDATNAPTSTTADLVVTADPTTVVISGTSSTTFGVPVTFTATVACSTACGTTPSGFVEFSQGGVNTDVDLVDGQATFGTDPTLNPSLGNEVDATFFTFTDGPGDFAASPLQSAAYDIGSVTLNVVAGDGVLADGTSPVAQGGTVTVTPSSPAEFSAALSAVNTGNGTPPGPLLIDIVVGVTDETSTLVTPSASQAAPTSDPGTGQTDYFWTIPANALTGISASGTATVTISSPGSADFVPITETFTVNW